MKYVEVIVNEGKYDSVATVAKQVEAADLRTVTVDQDGNLLVRLLIHDNKLQAALDGLQGILGMQSGARITVLPVDVYLPRPQEQKEKEEDAATSAREALHAEAVRGARLNHNYIILVVLSTLVAAIGMLENNVAVVVGAMVIAPLLGPNLAFALGTALGDSALMRESALTLLVGLALAISLSVVLAQVWPGDPISNELMMRTNVGLDGVLLALASGAAAALSLTTGLSSVLVGVMVAVALLPPAAALGMMLGYGRLELAIGAGLLLAINIVCVNLACKIVFLLKRIHPRVWWRKEKARRGMRNAVLAWIVSLIALIAAIYLRQVLLP